MTRGNCTAPTGDMGRTGFTIMEMVAAVTILLLLSAAIAQIFERSNIIWRRSSGGSRAEQQAREALGIVAADIREAMCGPDLPFVIRPAETNTSLGVLTDTLWLVSSRDDGNLTNRAVQVVWYGIVDQPGHGQVLMRRVGSVSNAYDRLDPFNIYWNSNSVADFLFEEEGVLADNVDVFWISATDDAGTELLEYDSRNHTNQLPAAVTLVLDVLDEESARQAAQLATGIDDRKAFTDRRSRRFTRLVVPQRRWSSGGRGR